MQDSALRTLAGFAVWLVAAIAATVSCLHVYRLAIQLGKPQLAAWLMPLSVDGSIGASSAALMSGSHNQSGRSGTSMQLIEHSSEYRP